MANIASAEKRNRQNIKRRSRNSAVRSAMRKAIKQARAAAGEATQAEAIKEAVRAIYVTASKNVIRAETASRYVSRLMKMSKAASDRPVADI